MSLLPDTIDAGKTVLPLLPLRDVVVYPQIVQPLFVGRPKSIRALEVAMSAGKQVLLVAQKNPTEDDPNVQDVFEIGTIASILQLIRLPDGAVKVLVEGVSRARIRSVELETDYFQAHISTVHAEPL